MECVVNDKRYDVMVVKHPVKKVGKAKGPECIDTVCMIFNVVDLTKKGDERRGDMLGRGLAHQSIKDRYDKWIGKKLAFQRALDDAQPKPRGIWEKDNKENDPHVVLTKDERRQLWDFFRNKFGGKRFQK